MTTLILHHYPTSPFSEKIRRVLAYKQLSWKSVIVPSILPKPDVQALTGGYRKTPFLQIGADIYCDSALVCDVLEQVQPAPSLYPPHLKGAAQVFAQWADNSLFWAAVGYTLQPRGAATMFANLPEGAAAAFSEDRRQMSVGMPRLRVPDATLAYREYLGRLASMLQSHPFLLGDQPSLADFAAYHSLWFTRVRVPVMADIFNATPTVLEWMDRMAALGVQHMEKFSAAEAIATAASAQPLALADEPFQDEHGIALGTQVSIAADIFGTEPTEGELVAATPTRYTLRRHDERAGTLHVHFPRLGFVLKKL